MVSFLCVCVCACVRVFFFRAMPHVSIHYRLLLPHKRWHVHTLTHAHTHTYSLPHPYSAAVYNWLKAGGRRIDASLTYHDQVPVGRGIKLSGLARNEVFITSKVGPGLPLGYKDTLSQFEQILASLETTYVDLVCTAG